MTESQSVERLVLGRCFKCLQVFQIYHPELASAFCENTTCNAFNDVRDAVERFKEATKQILPGRVAWCSACPGYSYAVKTVHGRGVVLVAMDGKQDFCWRCVLRMVWALVKGIIQETVA